MRELLAAAMGCVLIAMTGCASAQAVEPREAVVLEAREATFEPPAEPTPEAISGDLSAEEEYERENTLDEPETWLETDESALCGETEWAYAAEDYAEPEPADYAPQACGGDLRTNGVESDGERTYTWYSQAVLPGGGLDIPGRHVGEGGYVMDGDGNICVASSDLPIGTRIETPYGSAVVRDTGCASGVIDIYTDWS